MKLQMLITWGFLMAASQMMAQNTSGGSNIAKDLDETYAMHHAAPTVHLVNREAAFPGGAQALNAYLSENFNYRQKAAENGLEGTVLVKFTVRMDGKPIDPVITQSVHEIVDKEVIRLVKAMPDWQPRLVNGQAMDVKVEIPFAISLR